MPSALDVLTQAKDSHPQMPEMRPQGLETLSQALEMHPHGQAVPAQAPDARPQAVKALPLGLAALPQALESLAKALEACPQAAEAIPHAPGALVQAREGHRVIRIPNANRWNAKRERRRAPSPFLGGGEKVAAGRMRGGAANADARNPSPQPSPLIR